MFGRKRENDGEKGFFLKLKESLTKTKENLVKKVDTLLLGRKEINEEFLEELETILISADIGIKATQKLIQRVKDKAFRKELEQPDLVKDYLKKEVLAILQQQEHPLVIPGNGLFTIMTIGVNGTGKTTTIAKLAKKWSEQGRHVLLVAADTFRAAAVDQLEVWGKRVGCEVIKQRMGADPSAVVFDAVQAAKSRHVDIMIIDTAGRLHTKVNLMEELKKIKRIIGREVEGAPHETLLVLDATTGQNGINQARQFKEALGVSGIVLTKLDGTAKGGMIIGISEELQVPLRYIGIGEKIDDLREFQAEDFVEALFS
ncbi:MAG TPA: signal recognition particle-docking protein FtsY [Thermodesulfobacteriota bacterium]|nr:signal recognition particle-docking protein FtsY [Thermodesulfobacteriota bacterium]